MALFFLFIPSHHYWQYVTQSLKDFFRCIVFAD